jgi:hypothetical protein
MSSAMGEFLHRGANFWNSDCAVKAQRNVKQVVPADR